MTAEESSKVAVVEVGAQLRISDQILVQLRPFPPFAAAAALFYFGYFLLRSLEQWAYLHVVVVHFHLLPLPPAHNLKSI